MKKENIKIIKRKTAELIGAEYNPRQLSVEQFNQLKDSLNRFGFVDPILVNMNKDRENIVIGGHSRLKVATELGYTEVPCVELNLSLEQEKELNIRLNKNTGSFDFDMLANHFDTDDLISWGFEDWELDISKEEPEDNNENDNPYTDKIEAPIYEPSEEKPEVNELYNDDKVKELINDISKVNMPDSVREFLFAAATRHRVFDYRKIADYYAHADKEVQELMEDSALVIIDFDKAIENGFVKFSSELWDNFAGAVGE